MELWQASPEAFLETLRRHGRERAYIVTDHRSGEVRASHPCLDSVAHAVASDRRDYRGHEGCFFEIGRESGHLLSACVHRTKRGQAAGGVRFWTYDTVEAFVRDGLRLARGMGHKCALAGLWWGGGKGVVARRPGVDHRDPDVRARIYRDYGRFMSGLRGCYVTAEDVGTTPSDMGWVFRTTRFTTCIPAVFGGSGNPGVLTARGVVVAMEAALAHLGMGTLEGRTVAVQGLGNVTEHMIPVLIDRGVRRIIGADIDEEVVAQRRRQFPGGVVEARRVTRDDESIFETDCDILAPNAVGAVLNPRTIPRIRARVVCGAANNQLEESERDGPAIHERGVLYVPDFLANRMGIVNCANEQYGRLDPDPAIEAHLDRETPHGVYRRTLEVLEGAKRRGCAPSEEAERLADELAEEMHPLWGHRGQTIIDSLVADGWADGEPLTYDVA